MITFFDNSLSREHSREDIEIRSRSISSASNNSYNNFLKGQMGTKKYFNLAAMDGFAMMERDQEEEKYNLQHTVLEGMDVDSICADIADEQNKNYHLDKLFDKKGPYFTQTQRFEKDKRKRHKRHNRKKSVRPHGNFLDNINVDIYKDNIVEPKNYGIATLFEEPEEKEIRMNSLNKKMKKKKWT